MALPISYYNQVAQAYIDAEVNSSFYPMTPLLAIMTGKGMSTQGEKPGLRNFLQGLRDMPTAEKRSLRGSKFAEFTVQRARQGGAGGLGYRQSGGSVATTDIAGGLRVPWTMFDAPIKVFKDDLEAAEGQYRNLDLMKEHMQDGMLELQRIVSSSIFTGNPASQTANQMSDFVGLQIALDSGTTYADFYGGDKTADTYLKPGFFDSTTATPFSFDLIDQMNTGLSNAGTLTNPNGAPGTLGKGVDLVVANNYLFNRVIKPRARAEGQQIITSVDMPHIGLVGFEIDAVRYGRTLIIGDPGCPNGVTTGANSSMLFGLTTRSWTYETHPDLAFSSLGWSDLELQKDRERALQNAVQLKARLYTKKPELNGVFDDVV